jgi:hypothetical protein
MHEQHIVWCAGILAYIAASVIRKKSGLAVHVNVVARDAKLMHCRIHRAALAEKRMTSSCKLWFVLEESVKVINFVQALLLNMKFLSLLCSQIAANTVH